MGRTYSVAELAVFLKTRTKRWCFVLNNYTEEDLKAIVALHETEKISFLIIGKELAPSTGTPHLQAYLETTTRMLGSALKKIMPSGSVLIVAKGTAKEQLIYCSKDGDPFVLGEPMEQGKRKDLDMIREMIVQNTPWVEIADAHFGSWLRYEHGFKRYRQMKLKVRRNWLPEIFIHWGATGLGKTRKVLDEYGYDNVWIWNGNKTFYQDYDMQDICLFDDFYGEIGLAQMLKLCDRYPMVVDIKNGQCNWQPKKIYFTCNVDPRTWKGWEEEPDPVRAGFFRRVLENGQIVHFLDDLTTDPPQ